MSDMRIIMKSEAIDEFLKEQQEDIDDGYEIEEWGTTKGKCEYCGIDVTYPLTWEQGGVITQINHARDASPPFTYWCPRHFYRRKLQSNIPLANSKNVMNFFKTPREGD